MHQQFQRIDNTIEGLLDFVEQTPPADSNFRMVMSTAITGLPSVRGTDIALATRIDANFLKEISGLLTEGFEEYFSDYELGMLATPFIAYTPSTNTITEDRCPLLFVQNLIEQVEQTGKLNYQQAYNQALSKEDAT